MQKFFQAFPAFKYRNYKLYFTGQFISVTGMWLQIVAQGWLVLQLTHSAFLVGLVSALGSLPTLIFSLFGGAIVDRFPKKEIIIFTQVSSMILAFALAFLTISNRITVSEIIIISFLLGIVTAIDLPARQAFSVEMVGKKDLASAIALNSGIFNGARVIGPGIAGIIIALYGTGGAFLLNGISYIAVIIALFMISVKEVPSIVHSRFLKSIKEGVQYSFSHSLIRNLLIFTGVTSIFGFSYTTIMPVVVQNVYHRGADSLGYFYSASGLGALAGIIIVSWLSKKINDTFFILGGSFVFVISIIIFSFIKNETLAFVLLFFAGVGLLSQFAMINTAIQHAVDDHIRGRVMSMYSLMFLGMSPFGSLQIGFVAEHFGAQFAIRIGAIVMLLFCVYLFFNIKKIQKTV
ncbi:MAG: MFS transporter [Candidatus Levybacteria bacterium]|nr:MFS transporter [Candidatus Levybacteria bacterium]